MRLAILIFLALAGAAHAASIPTTEVARFVAPEAKQGATADAKYVYAIENSVIAKYDKTTRERLAEWRGEPAKYPHMNACSVVGPQLVCALSNYPATPMTSSVEFFDMATMAHAGSIPLPDAPGSVTWVDRRDGAWFAGFANYDGKGGEAGRDHTASAVVRFDDKWKATQTWRFPPEVLARFAPFSTSGGGFGDDGLLYVSGHDRPEVYAMKVDATSPTLGLVATYDVPVEGQAIAWDPAQPRVLWGISRKNREVVAFKLPPVPKP